MKKLFVFILIISTACFSCSRTRNFDYGNIENGTYKNDFFKLSLQVGDGGHWNILDRAQINAFQQMGADLIQNDDLRGMVIDAQDVTTATLLYMMHPANENGFSANLQLLAENLKQTNGINDGKQYLEYATTILQQANLPIKDYDTPVTQEDLDGEIFYSRRFEYAIDQMQFMQKTSVTIRDGFALLLIYTYQTGHELEEMENITSTLRFY